MKSLRSLLAGVWLCLLTSMIPAEGRYLYFGPLAAGGLVLTRADAFPAKGQVDGTLGATLEFYPVRFLGMGTSLRYHRTLLSTAEGGFLYRGHSGPEGRVFLTARHQEFYSAKAFFLGAGVDIGGLARFDHYSDTSLYFLHPGLFLQPFLDFTLMLNPAVTYRLFGFVDVYLRKDLLLSMASGIGFSLRFSPF